MKTPNLKHLLLSAIIGLAASVIIVLAVDYLSNYPELFSVIIIAGISFYLAYSVYAVLRAREKRTELKKELDALLADLKLDMEKEAEVEVIDLRKKRTYTKRKKANDKQV